MSSSSGPQARIEKMTAAKCAETRPWIHGALLDIHQNTRSLEGAQL